MPRIVLLGLLALGLLPAQPAFEAASVKRNTTPDPGRQGALFRDHIAATEGRVTLRNVTLQSCIKWAYGLQDPQIAGPDWIRSERYDVVAKASGPATEEQLRAMLKSLLAERFRLAAHMETRTLSAVELAAGKQAPRLRESDAPGAGAIRAAGGRIVAERATMAELAAALSDPLRAPVVDRTGLPGRYDFTLDFTSFVPEPGQTVDELSATVAVVRRQLGLELRPRKLPVPVLVVDRAEKSPAEN